MTRTFLFSFLLYKYVRYSKNTNILIRFNLDGTNGSHQTVSDKMTETETWLYKNYTNTTNVPSAHGGAASAKINCKNVGLKGISTRAAARKDKTRKGS
jgi:hypothetical protein